MLTVADMGEGGVKNLQKSADVLYGRSLSEIFVKRICVNQGVYLMFKCSKHSSIIEILGSKSKRKLRMLLVKS